MKTSCHIWHYPKGFVTPPKAPDGYRIIIEYDDFLGIEKRWRYEKIEEKSI